MPHIAKRSNVNGRTIQNNCASKSNWRTNFRDVLEEVHGVRGYRKTAAMDSNTDRGDGIVGPSDAQSKVGELNHW